MCGGYGNSHLTCKKQGESTCRFSCHAFQGRYFGDLGSHGLYDFPTTTHGAQAYGHIAGDGNPARQLSKVLNVSACNQCCANDTHHLLGIVSAVSNAEGSRTEQLKFLEHIAH